MKEFVKQFLNGLNLSEEKNYKGIIKIDMDDVLAQFDIPFLSLYNKEYHDHLKPSDMYDWDMSKYVKPECGNDIFKFLKNPGFFRYLEPTTHSKEVISRLTDEGYCVLIVSDSPEGDTHSEYIKDPSKIANPADDKRNWLKEHFPMIPQEHVIFGAKKQFVIGNVLIDDKPATFKQHTQMGLGVILIDRPYNQHIETRYRAKDMLEAERMIQDFIY